MCIALHFTTHHDNGVGTGGHGVILCFTGGRGGSFLAWAMNRGRFWPTTTMYSTKQSCALVRSTLAYLPILSKEARTAAAVLDTAGEQATTLTTEYPAWHGWSVWPFEGGRGGLRAAASGRKTGLGRRGRRALIATCQGWEGRWNSQLRSPWVFLLLMLGLGWNLEDDEVVGVM